MAEKMKAAAARRAAVAASGIGVLDAGGEDASLRALRRLGSVQIDTISVVKRAHHHILYTRNSDYKAEHIPALEAQPRRAIEYWSHAAAYLPIEDYRYCLPRMNRIHVLGHDWFKAEPRAIAMVRKRIEAEGPLRAQDFAESRESPSAWWNWKPAKIALEYLFHAGELVVMTRRGFQKIYELAERALPSGLDLSLPSDAEMAAKYIDQAISSLGVFAAEDIAYMRKDGLGQISAELAARVEAGSLIELGIADLPLMARSKAAKLHYANPLSLGNAPPSRPAQESIVVLSPFDPLIIDRKRTARLFGREYQLECYIPEAKRVFGYFAMPLLHFLPDGDAALAGLLDAKAERGSSTLVARRLSFDPPSGQGSRVGARAELARALAAALREFAAFNGLEKVELQRFESSDGRFERSLRAAVGRLTK
jgi:uncharacterized protein